MLKEAFKDQTKVSPEILPADISKFYEQYATATWHSLEAMVYPSGLPADHLHFLLIDRESSEMAVRIDRTSPTNIGYKLACDCAAAALGEITHTEAQKKIETTLITIQKMMKDPQVFVPTGNKEGGLFINWVQSSTGQALTHWLAVDSPIEQQLPPPPLEQQISSLDNAWVKAFLMLTKGYFPQTGETIDNILSRIDLPFMLDHNTGLFRGVYMINPPGFKPWQYAKPSESRVQYAVCDDNIAKLMTIMFNNRSEQSVFTDSTGRCGRRTWDGESFATFWPALIIPEDKLNPQWEQSYRATIQAQKDFGSRHNGGHYGYSAGLGPDGKYYEFRVPETGESNDQYKPQTVITISALVNMGIVEPIETCLALQSLHEEFKGLVHTGMGDGDTINTVTGEYQPDQLFPNQAVSLLTCWNILKNRQPQELFMQAAPPAIRKVYECPLW